MFRVQTRRGDVPWQALAAAVCFINAFLACLFGTLLTTGWILNEQLHPRLHVVGLLLLILALPVLVLGGHCLDLLEKKEKSKNEGEDGPLHALALIGFFACFFFVGPTAAQAQPPDVRRVDGPAPVVTGREQTLLSRIEQLEQRLAEIESRLNPSLPPELTRTPSSTPTLTAEDESSDFLRDTTFNVSFDGYFEQPGILKQEQNTATLGLDWRIGRKKGAW